MIKGTYFSKFLKLFSFGLLTSSIMVLGNSVNGAGAVSVIGNQYTSVVNSNYNILINGKGNLLTTYFGVGKRLFQIQDGVYFFRYTTSLGQSVPYIYINSYVNNTMHNSTQGFVKTYLLCDYIGEGSGVTSTPTNCVKYNIDDGNFQSRGKRITNSLNNQGYYYYNYIGDKGVTNYTDVYYGELTLCFSSKQYNKSLCFWGGLQNMFALPSSSKVSQITKDFYGGKSTSNVCKPYCSETNLSGSLNLSPYFDNVNNGVLGLPPGDYQGDNNIMSGNIVTSPDLITNQDIIDYFEKYNKFDYNICFLGTNDLSLGYSGDFVHGTGLTIFEGYQQYYAGTNVSDPYQIVANTQSQNAGAWINTLLNTYDTYMYKRQDYDSSCTDCLLYGYRGSNGYYSVWKGYYYDPFELIPSAFHAYATYVSNKYDYSDNNGQAIVEYCRAKLSSGGPNESYDGYISDSTVGNVTDTQNNSNNKTDWQNGDYQVPSGSGFMFTGSNDFGESARNFYAQLTSKLNIDGIHVGGNIPDYILGFMTLLILFRFLKK